MIVAFIRYLDIPSEYLSSILGLNSCVFFYIIRTILRLMKIISLKVTFYLSTDRLVNNFVAKFVPLLSRVPLILFLNFFFLILFIVTVSFFPVVRSFKGMASCLNNI